MSSILLKRGGGHQLFFELSETSVNRLSLILREGQTSHLSHIPVIANQHEQGSLVVITKTTFENGERIPLRKEIKKRQASMVKSLIIHLQFTAKSLYRNIKAYTSKLSYLRSLILETCLSKHQLTCIVQFKNKRTPFLGSLDFLLGKTSPNFRPLLKVSITKCDKISQINVSKRECFQSKTCQ